MFTKVQVQIKIQESNFTPESKRLIEAKIKKQNNGTYSIKKVGWGYGVSLKDENKTTLAEFF